MRKPFSIEDITEVMESLYKEERSKRRYVIHTGHEGRLSVDHTLKCEATRMSANHMLSNKKITPEEYSSIHKMIDSPDRENLTIAQCILETKDI